MAKKRIKKPDEFYGAVESRDIYTGASTEHNIFNRGKARPVNDKITDARRYAEQQWLVKLILQLKLGFFNYGVKVRPSGIESESKSEIKSKSAMFEDWWGEDGDINGDTVLDFIDDVWSEWLTIRNVISYWNDWIDRPLILSPENHRYEDLFGLERFWVRHGLSDTQLETKDARGKFLFPEKLRLLFKGHTEVECTGANGLYFQCLKQSRKGQGLATPDLESVLSACTAIESIEAGDNVLGQEARRLIVQHSTGHETRYGPMAGSNKNFIKSEWKNAVELGFKGKLGRLDAYTNYDQHVTYNYIDPKFFDPKKYDGSVRHLLYWGAPLTFMLEVSGGVAPFLMDILRTQALRERAVVGRYLNRVINAAFQPPMKLCVTWSDRVFKESRLAMDLLKIGLASGPLSQQTFREEFGVDNAEEIERKKREAKLGEAVTFPIYDASHGPPGEKKGGRPVGQPDEGKTK